MAKLDGDVRFTGSLGDLCAYRMRSTDKWVIRRKSGPTKERIKKDKNYAVTRLNNEEWIACTSTTRQVIKAMQFLRHLADYPYAGKLNAIAKSMQQDNKDTALGKRPVVISSYGYKLEGFNLTKENSFDTIVKHPLQYNINRGTGTAQVVLPDIVPGINLYNPKGQPLYRLVFTLGVIADMEFSEEKKMYQPATSNEVYPVMGATSWHSAGTPMMGTTILLNIPDIPLQQQQSLLLAAGIEFGIPVNANETKPVKYAGAAKILKLG